MAEEMTVKQIRIHKPRARRERSWREALPPDPRDPDVVRAKALARARQPRQRVTSHAVAIPRPADAGGFPRPALSRAACQVPAESPGPRLGAWR